MSTPWQAYRTMSWTSDNDECEQACGKTMGPEAYVEGELGHYCSRKCRDEAESGGLSDVDERAWERRQMGLCNF